MSGSIKGCFAFPFALLMVFSTGIVVGANLSRLVDTNPLYEASWWKVGFAIFIAGAFSAFAKKAVEEMK